MFLTYDGAGSALGIVPASAGLFNLRPVALPEASSLALLIVGLAAVGVAARRRRARMDNAADPGAVPDAGLGNIGKVGGR